MEVIMAKEPSHGRVGKNTKENLLMGVIQEKVKRHMQMEHIMKENGKKIYIMVKEYYYQKMEKGTKEILLMEYLMDKEN